MSFYNTNQRQGKTGAFSTVTVGVFSLDIHTQHLVAADLLDPQHYFRNSDDFEAQIMKALSKPVCLPLTHSGRLRAYVYPRLKARQITLSVESLYSGSGSIRSILESSLGSRHARQGIMSVTTGIGPKQSSLFLRNIGYAHDLAILDRHVLEYMNLLGIFPRGMNDVSTLPRYESAEDRLREYSDGLGTTPAELDTAIWVVMRVFERKVHP